MQVNIGPYESIGKEVREESIFIDYYDIWNLDNTLALIIHPALVMLKKDGHGTFGVKDEDVPEELRRHADAVPYECDELWTARYNYVMDEMILAFELMKTGDIRDAGRERVQRGINLFAKYYFNLWD